MPRLSKVTKELNVGLQTCVDFLQKKGHTVENSLNAKINDEQYELLVMQFSQDVLPLAFNPDNTVNSPANKPIIFLSNS